MSIRQIVMCKACGSPIPEHARFCSSCGRPAPELASLSEERSSAAGEPAAVPLVALAVSEAPSPNEVAIVAGALLVLVGVLFGVGGLFPAYSGGLSLVHQPSVLAMHALDLFGWAVAGIVLLVSTRLAHGAYAVLGAIGVSVVAFGYYLSDIMTAIAVPGNGLGAGFYLGLAGFVASLVGSVVALREFARLHAIGRFARPNWLSFAVFLAVIGVTVFYAPSWDRFVIDIGASHRLVVLSEGNAFANPGLVIFASVVVMVAMLAIGAMAGLTRPGRYGAALLGGMLVPVLGEVLAAFVQWTEPVPLSQFGISPRQAGLGHITAWMGFTTMFDLELVFVAALIALVALLWRRGEPQR